MIHGTCVLLCEGQAGLWPMWYTGPLDGTARAYLLSGIVANPLSWPSGGLREIRYGIFRLSQSSSSLFYRLVLSFYFVLTSFLAAGVCC